MGGGVSGFWGLGFRGLGFRGVGLLVSGVRMTRKPKSSEPYRVYMGVSENRGP